MNLSGYARLAREPLPLRFLVIGGYAVAAHGHARATFDVHFLADKADREEWVGRVRSAGLSVFAKNEVFVQFEKLETGDALDLMCVDGETLDSMIESAVDYDFGETRAPVPCLDHLLALKLHALKHTRESRVSRDAEDIEVLARKSGLDLDNEHYRALFLKYGDENLYETFRRILRRPEEREG